MAAVMEHDRRRATSCLMCFFISFVQFIILYDAKVAFFSRKGIDKCTENMEYL